MGGRLDATNVVTPLLSVITRVTVDHIVHLGNDVEMISNEKWGIIKQGRPVVCGMMADQALAAVRRVAREKRSELLEAGENVTVRMVSRNLSGQKVGVETGNTSYGMVRLPLPGMHQVENLATAIAVLEMLENVAGLKLRENDVRTGVSRVNWPGRCQVLQSDPLIILDGAHNTGAAEALAGTIKDLLKDRQAGLILGMCSDKDVKGFLRPFSNVVKRLWAVSIRSERSMPVSVIRSAGQGMNWVTSEVPVRLALKEAESWSRKEGGIVCVTGSLFLVGEVLELREKSVKRECER